MTDVQPILSRPIRVLVVDDNPSDAELARAELQRTKLAFSLEHATSREELLAKLADDPDVVLTDFSMPSFNGLEVLRLVLERRPEIPVIIVSGSIGEEQAVLAIKQGAFDYLLKDRLARLGQAVQRAVGHRKLQEAHRAAEEANARLISIIEGSPDLIAIADLQGRLIFLNAAGRRICGLGPGDIPAQQTLTSVVTEDLCRLLSGSGAAGDAERIRQGETELKLEDGRKRQVAYTLLLHRGADGRPRYQSVVTRDLTEHKRAEERIATLLRASQKFNSTLDREEMLSELVREALVLLDAAAGCAGVREGDRMHCRWYQTRHGRVNFEHSWRPGEGLPGWVFEHGAPYLSNKTQGDPQSQHALDARFNVRQALCLPIQDNAGQVIGFLEIHNKLHGEFTVGDIELMQGMTRTAAVALSNALAYEEVRVARLESARYAAGLTEIVELQQEINSRTWEMGEMLNLLLNRLGRLVEADGAVIEFREGEEMVYRAATGTAAGQIGLRLSMEKSLSGLCVREKRSLICHDAREDPRVDKDLCRRIGLRSMVVVPFHVDGEVGGVLKVYAAAPSRFTQSDQRLLEILSGLLGTSLQRQRAEESRQNSEREFRALFASSPVPMCVFDAESLRFMAVNEAAISNYGYSREEFLGMDISQILPAGEVPEILRALQKPGSSGRRQGHYRHRRKDGAEILAEVSSDEIVLRGRRAILIVASDVTRQKEAEEKIRQQARLLDLTTDAIIMRDLDGRVKYWNLGAEKLYGWTKAEALGQQIQGLVYRDNAQFDQAMVIVRELGRWQGELQHFNRKGKKLTVASRWTLVTREDGAPDAVLAINTDITERRDMELHFLRAQRMESIGTLAGGIAHDLNNILAPILMSGELLRRRVTDPAVQNILKTIETSARRGGEIVKQVLTFARGVEGERVSINLTKAIGDIETVIMDTFPKNIRLEKILPQELWPVSADPTQLQQVLLNLCVNARDAMPDGGTLRIVATNLQIDMTYSIQTSNLIPGRYVCLEVADSGVGIPRDIIDRIFEPFFTTKEVGKGTGLGLSTVQAIVKSHGGTISVYSEPRNGTTFKVYLPASVEGAVALTEEPDPIPRGAGETILLVDDESSVRAIARHTLDAFGYRVLDAGNGAEAVATFVENKASVNLVITDLMMPVMDGISTIHAIRQISPQIAIIASSGNNDHASLTKATSIGVRHFLAKPYDARKLLTTVRQALTEGKPA